MKDTAKKKQRSRYRYVGNLRFFVGEQWRFRKSYLLAAAAAAPMDAVYSVAAAFLPKVVLDCIERQTSAGELLLRVGLMTLLFVLARITGNALNAYCNNSRLLAEHCLWLPKLFEKSMDMDYHRFIARDTRVLREKARNTINARNGINLFVNVNLRLFSSLFGFTAFTAIIVRCSVWFIPVLIACYAVSALGWFLLQKYRDNHIKDARSAVMLKLRYLSFRSKDFAEAKDIRVYGLQSLLEKKTAEHMSEYTGLSDRDATGHFLNVLLEDLFTLGISLGAYAYLIHLKLHTDMSLGDFALYLGAITGFGSWLSQLVDNFSDVLECSHHVADFRTFYDLPDTMRKTGGIALPQGDAIPCEIEFDHVTFAYDGADEPILRDFSLTVRSGERMAIVGDNGAGKSTLVKLLCGLLLPQSGTIRVAGKDIREFNRDEYYTMLATVFQSVNILPASVAKNIALCEEKDIDRERLETCMRHANIYDKVQSLPDKENTLMVHAIHEHGVSFSGGEQQRLLLARALYKKNASILILDEPTAALDPIAENDLYQQYSTFAAGKTSLYISHRLSSTRFCDRIVLLENGGVAEIGTHDELMRQNGKYADMFRLQSRYYAEHGEEATA